MKEYLVQIEAKTISYVSVEASSQGEAEKIACKEFLRGECDQELVDWEVKYAREQE